MLLANLHQLDECRWTLKSEASKANPSVIFYANRQLMSQMDDKVAEQINNVSQLPGRVGSAMTMPDAHWGYGFPIGGVAAFDPYLGGIISAGGVGFDISCGVRCLRTNLHLNQLLDQADRLSEALYQAIPAGVGVGGKIQLTNSQIDDMLTGGARWAVEQGYGFESDLTYIEETGCMPNTEPRYVPPQAKKRQRSEMGTLGSGNHYLEVQIVDHIYDKQASQAYGLFPGQALIAIHCGSRGLGHQIGSDYLVALAKAAQSLGVTLPEKELACAPILSEEGQRYMGAMNAGINCALANRQILTHLARQSWHRVFPDSEVTTLYDVSHNTCKEETMTIDGETRTLYVHRKGATRAFGPGHAHLPEDYRNVGQPVLVGGSMGTGSYILAGNRSDQNQAMASASHGAGRTMSRRQATKQWQGERLVDELAEEGILIRSRSMRGVAEEAPGAYKDVDNIAEVTEKSGLARRVAALKPKICVKG